MHLACQYADVQELDEEHFVTTHPSLIGYLAAWRRFRADTGFVPATIEERVYHPIYRFGGTLDRRGSLSGHPAILDLKTPVAKSPATGIQLAAYALCFPEPHRRYAVHLRANGTYSLHEFQDLLDGRLFLAALSVATWRLKHQRGVLI